MLADFFSKPLQGTLFRCFRDVILGYRHIDTLQRIPTVPIEERDEEERIDTHVSALLKDTPTENTVTGKDGPSRIT